MVFVIETILIVSTRIVVDELLKLGEVMVKLPGPVPDLVLFEPELIL